MDRKNNQAVKLLPLLLLFLFTACEKDTVNTAPSGSTPPITSTKRNAYVVCEGTLGNGNASLYQYTIGESIVYNDVYKGVNSELLGDVFQSMTRIGDRLFLCVNNSDKIIVLSADTKKKVGQINIAKPRYVVAASPTKAYVSTLFSDKVYIINPQTLEIKGTVKMPYLNPENMVLFDSKLYVCCWDTNTSNIYTIDIATNNLDSIPVAGRAPHDIALDRDGKLWVITGNAPKNIWATLTRIETISGQTMKSYNFPPLAEPMRLEFNSSGDQFYFIEVDYNGATKHNGIYTMHIYDGSLPSSPMIPAAQFQYYWALGIDKKTDDIYVGDPKGFIQKGTVTVYRPDGTKKSTFDVGVGPGQFYFEQ